MATDQRDDFAIRLEGAAQFAGDFFRRGLQPGNGRDEQYVSQGTGRGARRVFFRTHGRDEWRGTAARSDERYDGDRRFYEVPCATGAVGGWNPRQSLAKVA